MNLLEATKLLLADHIAMSKERVKPNRGRGWRELPVQATAKRAIAEQDQKFRGEYLLSGIGDLVPVEGLPHSQWSKLNKHDGRNDRLLHALLCAYAKYHLDNNDIGSGQLDEIMWAAICNEIGDDAFCEWIEQVNPKWKEAED
jgi:hypothetical protein